MKSGIIMLANEEIKEKFTEKLGKYRKKRS